MPPRAQLEAVTLSRGGRTVLADVDLAVPAAGITAIVGASGAGKSSVLRCLARLEAPDGRVLVDGVDVRDVDPCRLRRRVGLVVQAPVMLEGTVADNLAYGLEAPGPDRLEAAARQAGLAPGMLERDAWRLSGGESMRVAIARALTRDPVLLALDEPTAALDRATAAGLEAALAELAAGGTTVLIVTHDTALAARLAGHIVRLADGRVTAAGAPAEVMEA